MFQFQFHLLSLAYEHKSFNICSEFKIYLENPEIPEVDILMLSFDKADSITISASRNGKFSGLL